MYERAFHTNNIVDKIQHLYDLFTAICEIGLKSFFDAMIMEGIVRFEKDLCEEREQRMKSKINFVLNSILRIS